MIYITKNKRKFKSMDRHILLVSEKGLPIIRTPHKGKLIYRSWEQLDFQLENNYLKGRYEEVV